MGDIMETDNRFLEAIEEAIEDGRLEPTSWEEDFLDSIRGRIDSGYNLTRKQRESLDRIHEKIRVW